MIKARHIAQVCREAMSALSGSPHWGELSDRQRRSSLTIVNFLLANPETSSLAVHNAWMGDMIHIEGWQHGEIYDADTKRHPNLVAYEVLPRHVQDSYVISIGIVRGMLDIGDRYESCAPAQSVRDVTASAPPPVAPAAMPAPDAGMPTQDDETSANEGGVHFTAHNTLTESSPESGDAPPETDPAAAE